MVADFYLSPIQIEQLTTQYDDIIKRKVEELNAVLIEASVACGMRYHLPRRMAITGHGKSCLIIKAERLTDSAPVPCTDPKQPAA